MTNPERGPGGAADGREQGPERKLSAAFRSLPSEHHPEENEDAFLALPERGLFGIFDGLGGHLDGGRASATARDAVLEALRARSEDGNDIESAKREVAELFHAAHEALRHLRRERYGEREDASLEHGGEEFPDTTFTLVRIVTTGEHQHFLAYAHAGDSRLYVDRRSEDLLEQVTDDDDFFREIIPNEADRWRMRRVFDNATSLKDLPETVAGTAAGQAWRFRAAVGSTLAKPSRVHVSAVPVEAGDRVILTSDGIHDNLTFAEMQNILGDADSAEDIARELARRAKERSLERGHLRAKPDDMTVVAVDVS